MRLDRRGYGSLCTKRKADELFEAESLTPACSNHRGTIRKLSTLSPQPFLAGRRTLVEDGRPLIQFPICLGTRPEIVSGAPFATKISCPFSRQLAPHASWFPIGLLPAADASWRRDNGRLVCFQGGAGSLALTDSRISTDLASKYGRQIGSPCCPKSKNSRSGPH
jgi:hypothetical protein